MDAVLSKRGNAADTPSAQLGLGLIGAGGFGRFCLEQYRGLEGVRAVAVADVAAEAAADTAEAFGISRADTPGEGVVPAGGRGHRAYCNAAVHTPGTGGRRAERRQACADGEAVGDAAGGWPGDAGCGFDKQADSGGQPDHALQPVVPMRPQDPRSRGVRSAAPRVSRKLRERRHALAGSLVLGPGGQRGNLHRACGSFFRLV